jgi:N-acetylneuraminic acid mutarotase
MLPQRILARKCLLNYMGEISTEHGLPFKYVDNKFGTLLLYTGKGDLESDILDLYEAVRQKNFNVAAQLPLLEDLCPQYAEYQGETDEYIAKLVSNGILDKEDRYTLTEKGFDLLNSQVDIGAVAGVGFSLPMKMGKYLRSKFAEIGISVKKPSKLKAFLAAAVMVAAGVGGAAISKNVHAGPGDVEQNWYEKSLATHPSERQDAAMASVYGDSKVILFGGSDAYNTVRFNDTWAYDASTNNWEEKTPAQAPSARIDPAMAGVYGTSKIVLFGGWDGAEKKDTWVYDAKAGNWTKLTPQQSPPARDSAAMASVYGDDKVVLFGGIYGEAYPQTIRGDTWIYDLSDNNWTQGPSGPPARERAAMVCIHGDSKIVMFGGAALDATLGDTWLYDLKSNQWTEKTPAQSPLRRMGHAMASIYGDDKVVMFGGEDQFTDTWTYDLSDNTWLGKRTSPFPDKRSYHSMAGVYGKKDVVLFGGFDENFKDYGDTWVYSQAAPPQNPSEFVVVAADLHIGAENANKTLEDFVTQVNGMNPAPACVVIAGDASDWGADQSPLPPGSNNLKQAKTILAKLSVPYYVVPGNHDARYYGAGFGSTPGSGDNFTNYKSVMPAPSNSDNYKIDLGNLTIFCLNSGTDKLDSVVGDPLLPESTGLTDSQVSWLETALKSTPTNNQRVLVMHNPLTVSKDGSISNNYAELVRICQQYKVTVVAGHTHQLEKQTVAGVDSWQVPSLACQKSFEIVSFANNKAVLSHRVVRESTGIESHSPVDVNVIGPDGRTSGISLEGKLKQELPGTVLVVSDKSLKNDKDRSEFLSVDGVQKKFSVRGLDDGKYNIKASVNDNESHVLEVSAKTKKGQVDTYEVRDWDAVAKNKPDAVKVSRDTNGDGKPEITFNSDGTITDSDFAKASKPASRISWQSIAGAAAGMAAAVGVGLGLLRRRKPKNN